MTPPTSGTAQLRIEVRFEKERINSLADEGELLITIMASFAQEEVRSLSENVKWGLRKRFEQGMPNGHFHVYGYRWEGDHLVIQPDEAAIVRRIFQNFLQGKSRLETEREFAAEGITTAKGCRWVDSNIKVVLTNVTYEAQLDYYTNFIRNHDGWEFVNVYADEGITGTSTKHREGFKQMVADALAGKIDLIVTKSVSRFARNTVDSLTTIRQLKEHGTECYFEKENIWTFDSKGELLITIMSSLAQEESRSISENCTWGQRKRMADGKVSVPFSRFLGYDRGENGELVVNPEQAEIVKRIYTEFLQGATPHTIAAGLTADGIRSPGGKDRWNPKTVQSILQNEKYKGDALLQKCFTEDFLTKKQVKNQGQVPQYYVTGDHEAIIPEDVFDMVQREISMRKPGPNRHSGVRVFSSTIYCGECGGIYGSKVWHSNDKYRRVVWRCNRKYDGDQPCGTPHFDEETLKQLFLSALNKLVGKRNEIRDSFYAIRSTVFSTDALEAELAQVEAEMSIAAEQVARSIRENAMVALDQSAYRARHDALCDRYESLKARCAELKETISDKQTRLAAIDDFLRTLMKQEALPTAFDPMTYHILVERMTVYGKDKVMVRFKNGMEIQA